MFHVVYLFWALIPLSLYFLTLRAAFRIMMKRPGREYPLRYLKQAAYTTVILVVAILFDQWATDGILDFVGRGWIKNDVVRWAVYPLVLTVFAYIQKPMESKEQRVFSDELRAKMKLAR